LPEILKRSNIIPKVLVAPLDWGLGHVTRCIPLIRGLRERGCVVVFAGETTAIELISNEFPDIQTLPLQGYRIRYGARFLGGSLVLQIPGILRTIRRERAWLSTILKAERLDAVISDNRWGLYHKKLYNIFITHQLYIQTPYGKAISKFISGIHHRYIRKFQECWVPDSQTPPDAAGALSHPSQLQDNTHYIGILSRFAGDGLAEIQYDLAIVLSGPEPQRTLLEEIMVPQLLASGKKTVLVCGKPGEHGDRMLSSRVRKVSHLTAPDLEKLLKQSNLVICRSGYSSIMDLIRLGKKAVLIPTPGQPEQEYLAAHMMSQKFFYAVGQDQFRLNELDSILRNFPFTEIPHSLRRESFQATLDRFVAGLRHPSGVIKA
jgi:UDP-N-acetylglucosamine transferase subunit ALG13